MSSSEIQVRRKNTIILFSSINRYDNFKKVSAISPQQYSDDFHFYSDTVQQRSQRNKNQIKKLLSLLKLKIMIPQMLQFNGSNTFYPSYILHHHFFSFYQLVLQLSNTHPHIEPLLLSAKNGQTLGAIFDDLININFQKPKYPQLINGVINMRQGDYFYSNATSLNIDVCCLKISDNENELAVFIKLRDSDGNLCKGVDVRDMGAKISPDYLNIGYRFNEIIPNAIIEVNKVKLFKQLKNNQKLTQLGFSVQDFSKALHIAVNYTQMRRQFATKDNDKTQRQIIQYQAVHSRIIDAFSYLYALASMQKRILDNKRLAQLLIPFLPIHHRIILQKIMSLRQCCGGFGFMQISGFPALMQRISYRASQQHPAQIPQLPDIMKIIHFYSSSDQTFDAAIKNIDIDRLNTFEPIFRVFATLCLKIRKNKEKINPVKYLEHMITQSCLQMMYRIQLYSRPQPNNPSQDFLYHLVVNYILDNATYIDWRILKGYNKEKFLGILLQTKTSLIQKIYKNIPKLADYLEIDYLRNVIVGSNNQQQFYERVMKSSKENKRNSEEYKKQIQKQLIQLIKEQRAKL